VTPVGLAVVGLVVAANAGSGVGLGTSGAALVVTVGVALYAAAAVVFLLWFDAPRPVTVALLLLMAASATATHHADPRGTGGIGLYLGMAFAPLRLPLRTAAAVSALGVAGFDTHLALVAPNEGVFIMVVTGGAAFFFVLGLLLRREQDQRRHIAGLLLELEASREAERASAALAERSRLAREMHDVLAHTLSGLVLQLDAARLLVRSEGTPDGSPTVTATLDRAHALARGGLAEARQAITALRGDRLPGPELLAELVDEHRRTSAGACRLTVTGEPTPLPPDARLAVYRTAQEALSNVRKHAPGADVDVRLCWTPDEAVLEVDDRGGRADVPDATGSGYGLTGMAERAQLLGGSLSAGPSAAGFRVSLRIPLRRAP
jgi:signal transduction histidine kinase